MAAGDPDIGDRAGLAAARNVRPYIIQVYPRDMGDGVTVVMREIDGLSYDEMATVMNVSKGTIMSRLFHARQKLQRSLSDYYREQIGVRPSGEVPAPASEPGSER